MDECVVKMVAEIDEALECKVALQTCRCSGFSDEHFECDSCKIKRVLRLARVCVIQGAERLGYMQMEWIGFQDEIVAKLKEIVSAGSVGNRNAGFEEEGD